MTVSQSISPADSQSVRLVAWLTERLTVSHDCQSVNQSSSQPIRRSIRLTGPLGETLGRHGHPSPGLASCPGQVVDQTRLD
eukprot:10388805-Lingulodinium_polyedra.AAC.1